MVRNPSWTLTSQATLALAVSATFPAGAFAAEVARVQFAAGQVNATGPDGRVRVLRRGADVNQGETVNTEQGRVQLKFRDGALVSLQPRTAFRIDEYAYRGKPDGTERGFFSLLRGGLRTITGLIGRSNNDSYRVRTQTATIGIRGTEYIAEVGNSLRVSVGGGRISVTNDAGTFIVEQGQTAYVADASSQPVIELQKPVLPPQGTNEGTQAPTAQKEVVTGEVPGAVAGGESTEPEPPITPATHVGSFVWDGGSALHLSSGNPTLSGSQLTAFTDPSTGTAYDKGTATVHDASYDNTIGVARWSNGTFSVTPEGGAAQQVAVGANQGLHAVFGTPTPTMPTSMTATYGLAAATQATSSDGSLGLGTVAPGLGSGRAILAVDFASGRIGTDFTVTFPEQAYRVTTTGGVHDVSGSEIQLLGSTAPGVFANTISVPTTAVSGNACLDNGCTSTDVLGFFAGDAAARAGFTYRITDNGLKVNGAVAAGPGTVGPLEPLPPPPPVTITHTGTFVWDGGSNITDLNGNPTLTGSQLTAFENPNIGAGFDKGTATVHDAAYDNTIGVARWSNGTFSVTPEGGAAQQVAVSANQGLHAVFGTPTPTMPTSMTATYGLAAATQATSSDGSLGLGSVAAAQGSGQPILAVDFASGRVGTDFTVTFPGQAYRVTSTGGIYDVSASEIQLLGSTAPGVFANTISVPTTAVSGNACLDAGCTSTDVLGFFAGDNASRAGFNYRITDNALKVNGAIAAGPAVTGGALTTQVTPITAAFAAPQNGASIESFVGTGTANLDASNRLIAFSGTNDYCCGGTVVFSQGTATFAQSGYDGIIGFGRLANGTASLDGGEGAGPVGAGTLHLAFGAPTPSGDLSALATGSTPTATYSLLAATGATATHLAGSGTVSPGQGAGQPILSVDFASGKVGVDFKVDFAGENWGYRVMSTGGLYNLASSQIAMVNVPTSASFKGDFVPTTGTAGDACNESCNTEISGFFAGANATRAGFSYRITDSFTDNSESSFTESVYGAVNAGPATPRTALLTPVTAVTVVSGRGGDYSPDMFGAEGTASLNASGQLIDFTGSNIQSGSAVAAQGSATLAESGHDGTVGYGRFSNGTVNVDGGEGSGTATQTLSANQGLHYAFGPLAPSLPTSAVIASYNLLGATKATSDSGDLGLGTFTGSLAVDFATQKVGIDMSVQFADPASTRYHVMTNGGTGAVLTSQVQAIGGIFNGSLPVLRSLNNGAEMQCASGCSSRLTGFFSGTNAERAGMGYRINDGDTGQNVSGAATFTQSVTTPLLGGTNVALNFAGAVDNAPPLNSSDSFKHLDTTGTIDAATGALSAINEGGNTTIGTASVAQSGRDDIIGWARWTSGTLGGAGTPHANAALSGDLSFHSVYGTPTSASDMAALQAAFTGMGATYTLIGNTSPTNANGGSAPGTLTGAMTAWFGSQTVDVSLSVNATSALYSVSATGLPIVGSGFGGTTNSVSASPCSGCSADIKGFFAGPMAARAGVAYTIKNFNSTVSVVNGTAAFARTGTVNEIAQ